VTYPPQQPPPNGPQQPYGTQPGYPVQPPPYGQPMAGQYPPRPPKKKTPVWPFIIIGVPILLCGGCLGIAGLASNSDPKDAASTTTLTSIAAVAAPGAPQAPAPAAPTSQAPSRGKNVAAPGSAVRDGKFEFQVTSVETPVTALGSGYRAVTAKGEFIVIRMDITNTGNKPQSYFDSNQTLIDEQGREFANDSSAVRALGSEDWESDLNPGFKIQVALVFDVPAGTVPTTLELHDSMFSGGAKVALR